MRREFELVVAGETVTLQLEQQTVGDVGGVVWDSALVACRYLERRAAAAPSCFVGRRVLELGAGTGICGLVMAALGADVTLTDLPEQLALVESNIAANRAVLRGSAVARPLVWGDAPTHFAQSAFDVILLIDCLYYDQSLRPLISTLEALSSPVTEVLCVYEERDIGKPKDVQQLFFKEIADLFDISKVPMSDLNPDYSALDIPVYSLQNCKIRSVIAP